MTAGPPLPSPLHDPGCPRLRPDRDQPAEDAAVWHTFGFDRLSGPSRPVDHGRHNHHRRTRVADGVHRRQGRASGGAGVLHDEHSLARHVGALDLSLQPMGFRRLAHDEGVDGPTGACMTALATGSAPMVSTPTAA